MGKRTDTFVSNFQPSPASSWDRRGAQSIHVRHSQLGILIGVIVLMLGLGCLLITGCAPGASGGGSSTSFDNQSADTDQQEQASTPQLTAEQHLAADVQATIDKMTLEQKVAQLFFVAPESITNMGTVIQAGDTTREALATYPVGGLIYFQQNLVDSDQTKTMLANTQSFAQAATDGLPIFLAVDEEGGTVSRIGGNPGFAIDNVGDMAAVGATGDVAAAQAVAEKIGHYLKDLGFNTDFAPDADIATNPDGTMTQRSFGSDQALVAKMVEAQVKGFLSTGILCAAKHFPGIGGVVGDSHTGAITSDLDLADIEATELGPFEAAIAAGVPFVMVGHLNTPAATHDSLPASLSKSWIQDTLRDHLHFNGIVITDSLGMGAVSNLYSADRIGVEALLAGNDMILMPTDFVSAYNGVMAAAKSGELTEERINESLTRILTVKLRDLAQ